MDCPLLRLPNDGNRISLYIHVFLGNAKVLALIAIRCHLTARKRSKRMAESVSVGEILWHDLAGGSRCRGGASMLRALAVVWRKQAVTRAVGVRPLPITHQQDNNKKPPGVNPADRCC